jgi:hypothetical protein
LVDWLQKIGNTRNHYELLNLAREYLAAWYHGDLAQIDEACRPTRIKGVDDLHFWSERLAEGYCGDAVLGDRPDLHREMLTFFMEASRRAGQLRDSPSPLGEGGVRVGC